MRMHKIMLAGVHLPEVQSTNYGLSKRKQPEAMCGYELWLTAYRSWVMLIFTVTAILLCASFVLYRMIRWVIMIYSLVTSQICCIGPCRDISTRLPEKIEWKIELQYNCQYHGCVASRICLQLGWFMHVTNWPPTAELEMRCNWDSHAYCRDH